MIKLLRSKILSTNLKIQIYKTSDNVWTIQKTNENSLVIYEKSSKKKNIWLM